MSMTEPQKESATAFSRIKASKEDILDLLILIEERDSFPKIMELSKALEQAPRMLPLGALYWDSIRNPQEKDTR